MESGCSCNFTDLSVRVAERFLQTVVIVDDQAGYKSNQRSGQPKKVDTPSRSATKSATSKVKNNESKTVKIGNVLDTKQVIDSFASKGIVCSVLEPSDDKSEMFRGICEVAKRADVFVIDWQIRDDGQYTLEVISKIIMYDLEEGPGLRLIVVYTGENGLDKIFNKIKQKAEHLSKKFKFDENKLNLTLGHLRILILAKEGFCSQREEGSTDSNYESNIVSEERLPERIIFEFACMTKGLVSNVALESLSILRRKTPLILGNLSSKVDPPYLAHRALLPDPEDATNHVIDIISSELRSILDDYEVGKVADETALKAWLDMKNEKCHQFKLEFGKTKTESVTCDDLYDIVKNGFRDSGWLDKYIAVKHKNISDPEVKKRYYENDVYKNITKTFCLEGEDSNRLDLEFAILCSLNSTYGNSSNGPTLTLGTILKKSADEVSEESPEYWLCIQPRCDSFRIDECRKFVFLQLIIPKLDESKFNLVVSDNSEYVKLKIMFKVYNTIQFEFEPNGQNRIKGVEEEGTYIFTSRDGAKFKWIAELKRDYAQRVSNEFAAELSRVGLDEPEWLRRQAPR